jgi:hypothetical protein
LGVVQRDGATESLALSFNGTTHSPCHLSADLPRLLEDGAREAATLAP